MKTTKSGSSVACVLGAFAAISPIARKGRQDRATVPRAELGRESATRHRRACTDNPVDLCLASLAICRAFSLQLVGAHKRSEPQFDREVQEPVRLWPRSSQMLRGNKLRMAFLQVLGVCHSAIIPISHPTPFFTQVLPSPPRDR